MIFRRAFFLFVAFLLVRTAVAAPAADNTLHWLGLKQISADTNAAPFLKVWRLPQTTALVAQTLDKLSRWPGHGATNTASAAFRPLLDDLVNSEFYLEISTPTNSQSALRNPQLNINSALRTPNSALLLAVHLPADRANFWQTNLAAASAAWAAAGTPHRIECFARRRLDTGGRGPGPKKIADGICRAPRRRRLPVLVTGHSSLVTFPSLARSRSQFHVLYSSLVTRHCPRVRWELSYLSHLHLTVYLRSQQSPHPRDDRSGPAVHRAAARLGDSHQPHPRAAHQFCRRARHRQLAGRLTVLAETPAHARARPGLLVVARRHSVPDLSRRADARSQQPVARLSQRLMQNANPWLATNAEGSFSWNPFVARHSLERGGNVDAIYSFRPNLIIAIICWPACIRLPPMHPRCRLSASGCRPPPAQSRVRRGGGHRQPCGRWIFHHPSCPHRISKTPDAVRRRRHRLAQGRRAVAGRNHHLCHP